MLTGGYVTVEIPGDLPNIQSSGESNILHSLEETYRYLSFCSILSTFCEKVFPFHPRSIKDIHLKV